MTMTQQINTYLRISLIQHFKKSVKAQILTCSKLIRILLCILRALLIVSCTCYLKDKLQSKMSSIFPLSVTNFLKIFRIDSLGEFSNEICL